MREQTGSPAGEQNPQEAIAYEKRFVSDLVTVRGAIARALDVAQGRLDVQIPIPEVRTATLSKDIRGTFEILNKEYIKERAKTKVAEAKILRDVVHVLGSALRVFENTGSSEGQKDVAIQELSLAFDIINYVWDNQPKKTHAAFEDAERALTQQG